MKKFLPFVALSLVAASSASADPPSDFDVGADKTVKEFAGKLSSIEPVGPADADAAPSEAPVVGELELADDFAPAIKAFLDRHSPETIVGMQLIHVKAGSEIGSMWGHVLWVLQTAEQDYALGINVVPGQKAQNLKMIVGGTVALNLQFDTLEALKKQYLEVEGRRMLRYSIRMDKLDVKAMLERLRAWADDPSSLGHYSFFHSNCATVMERFIKESSLSPLKGRLALAPWGVKAFMEKNGLLKEELEPWLPLPKAKAH